jgi:hypothetical protein
MTTEATPASDAIAPTTANEGFARIGEILREIATGGVAALIAGILVGGLGGRLVMRLAAILVPETAGRTTENGNSIGAITVDGTLLLIVFGGLLTGVVAGGIWVVVRPWLPADRGRRVLVSIPLALAFGAPLLIEGDNLDFAILGNDPVVIAMLLVLVAAAGPALALIDDSLGRRLPSSRIRVVFVAYALVAAIGLFFTLFLTVPVMVQSDRVVVLFAIVAVGVTTLIRWADRLKGRAMAEPGLERIARGALAVAVALGLGTAMLDVLGALGLR